MNILYTDEFIKSATSLIVDKIKSSLTTQQSFILGLSGGSTPKPIYQALATRSDIDWSKIYVTFSDEQTVGPDHDDSNYKMANDLLLSKVAISESQVLRMKGELGPIKAAVDYERQLTDLQNKLRQSSFQHDLLLLGLGSDGHTASLFPGTKALNEQVKMCVANPVPQLDTTRVTLTYPAINNSKEIVFLVSGINKIEVTNKILNGQNFPAVKVKPINGPLTWLLDWLPDEISANK